MSKRCGDCKRSLKGLRWAPMVHSHVWRAVSDPGRFLCEGCFRQRMRRVLGRELRFEDLTVCPFNLYDGHHKELTLPGKQRTDFWAAALNLPAHNSEDQLFKLVPPLVNRSEMNVDSHFGGCPYCGRADSYAPRGRDHWFYCKTHKTMWTVRIYDGIGLDEFTAML